MGQGGMDTAAAGETALDVVINEVAWMGTPHSAYDEWLELRNNTPVSISLDGWRLSGAIDVVLSGVIPSYGYFLLERTDDTTVSDIPADGIYTGGLNDTGEALTLTNAAGTAIDVVWADEGWPAGLAHPERTMERVNPVAPGSPANWATHEGMPRTGLDASGNPLDGTPRAQNARYDAPGLSLAVHGPVVASPHLPFMLQIVVSNTAVLPIAGVTLSGVLGQGVELIGQSSPLTWTYEVSGVLTWQAGSMDPGVVYTIVLAGQSGLDPGGIVTGVVTARENSGCNRTAVWQAPVVPGVRIEALHPWAVNGGDEAAALINRGADAVSLAGWGLGDGGPAPDVTFPGGVLLPGQVIWLAEDADAFYAAFGRAPDWATHGVVHEVQWLAGRWPGFTNNGEQAVLYDPSGQPVDVLVYGDETPVPAGWFGRPVSFPRAGFGPEGQMLYRKREVEIARPVPDTDAAADWVNDDTPGRWLYGPVHEGDLSGKRVVYPGWDWGVYTGTFAVTATARLTVAVAPDNAYTTVAALVRSARHSVLVAAHTLESVWLTGVFTERIAAGVQVTMLLEGSEVTVPELWNCARIVEAGGRVLFMHNDPPSGVYDRYLDLHSKVIVVDGQQVAISSENWGNHALPVDDKANGTAGNRGVILITDQPDVVRYVAALLDRDNDPARYRDLVPYGALDRYTAPLTYTAVYSPGGGGYDYMAPFSQTAPVFTADFWEVLHSPETSLGYSDGLLGLLLRAGPGDEVYVEQMYERVHWGSASSDPLHDPNPRLEAYVQAARQGARVRILLDQGFDSQHLNEETAFYLLALARAEGLDLEVRLGNPTQRGIHNKMVLINLGGARYVHAGSINGSEVSIKANRELALQVRSAGAYEYLKQVWTYDWTYSQGPWKSWLPIVYRQHVPEATHALISEVMFKQAGGGDEGGEWIELYNPTLSPVDLSGWYLGDAAYATDYERLYTFPTGTTLPAGQTLVIARRAAAYQGLNYPGRPVPDLEWEDSGPVPDMQLTAWGGGACALGNAGDEVILLDQAQRIVDVLVYGDGSYPHVLSFGHVDAVYNGSSLERRPANRDSDDCAHDWRIRYTPDPGCVIAW